MDYYYENCPEFLILLMETVSKKLKLMTKTIASEKMLQCHEGLTSMVIWTKAFFFFLEKFEEPSGTLSYILNVHLVTIDTQ